MNATFFGILIITYIVLSPGVILHLPFSDEDDNYLVLNSGNTSMKAVIFHGFVYAGVVYLAFLACAHYKVKLN